MRRTTRRLLAVLALTAGAPAAAQDTGFYVGLALGQASYREGCADFSRVTGAPPGAFACQQEDTAGKVFGGWRFHRNLAAEISYIDYGTARATSALPGTEASGTTKVKAAGLSAIGIVPLGEQLALLGRLGLLETRIRTQVSGAASGAEEKDETELHVGIGALFRFGRGWGLRGEYERVNDSKIDLFSLGVQYQF